MSNSHPSLGRNKVGGGGVSWRRLRRSRLFLRHITITLFRIVWATKHLSLHTLFGMFQTKHTPHDIHQPHAARGGGVGSRNYQQTLFHDKIGNEQRPKFLSMFSNISTISPMSSFSHFSPGCFSVPLGTQFGGAPKFFFTRQK